MLSAQLEKQAPVSSTGFSKVGTSSVPISNPPLLPSSLGTLILNSDDGTRTSSQASVPPPQNPKHLHSNRGVSKSRALDLENLKLDIQEYVKKTGVGYTFIDVGWCETGTSASYPTLTPQGAYRSPPSSSTPARASDRYVFCWAEEVMQNEAPALARRGSSGKVKVKVDQLPLWVKGDNTVENAKGAEYGAALDAGELYPDLGKDAALTRGVCEGSSLRVVLLPVHILLDQHLERRDFLPNSVSSRLSFALILSTCACIIKTSAFNSAS
ncbi:NAD-binding protein [Sanghuangporus baumii]|uniref:NAD-binding protein n=1 Tax=Sanghuangporus baumii TaxID=108892 RepID=A0A9Q5HS83_SANBA|nr:NAD-binding protein [Sanghuangporus baumii]